MRIKILTIIVLTFFVRSGYSQQLKHLQNGFVAATEQGVWYMQDGFPEWVSLEAGYYNHDYDTITAIQTSYQNIYNFGIDRLNSSYMWPFDLFGKNNNEQKKQVVTGNAIFKTKLMTSTKNNNNVIYATATTAGTTGNITVYDNFYKPGSFCRFRYPDSYDYSILNAATSISSDNDSIFVWVGTQNTMYKTSICNCNYYTYDNDDLTYDVSGLHSNASHAHQIAYNPDDDYFLIVSDSGIVYKYDKTTVTTLDTLPVDSDDEYPVDTIFDIHYSQVDNVFIIATRQTNNQLNWYIWDDELIYDIGSDIESIYSLVSSDNKGNVMLCTNELIVVADLSSVINEEEGYYYVEYEDLTDRTIFDLDYIDYMPYKCLDGYAMIGDSCYKTVTIGTQTWLANNLYYDDGEGDIFSYNDNPVNSLIYGYLYTWDAAMRIDELIDGWHIPTNEERDELITYLGTDGGSKLAGEYDLWNTGVMRSSVNFNQTGFDGIPAGLISGYTSSGLGEHTTFWTSTEDLIYPDAAGIFKIIYNDKEIYSSDTFGKDFKFSVRLIKD